MVSVGKNNPRVKYVRRLMQRKYREQEGKFIVEGVRFLEEAVNADWPLEMVFYSPGLPEIQRGALLLKQLEQRGIPMFVVDEALLASLTDTASPQGVLAVAPAPQYYPDSLMHWNSPEHNLLVLVDGIRDPGNLGTIIRCAGASGAQGVFISKGTVDPYNPKTLRSTMGSVFHVPIITVPQLNLLLTVLKSGGWQLVAGDPTAHDILYHCDLTGRVVLAVGEEACGISDTVKRYADKKVLIPMPGRAESLNAGVALGIMLYEVVRQRSVK